MCARENGNVGVGGSGQYGKEKWWGGGGMGKKKCVCGWWGMSDIQMRVGVVLGRGSGQDGDEAVGSKFGDLDIWILKELPWVFGVL